MTTEGPPARSLLSMIGTVVLAGSACSGGAETTGIRVQVQEVDVPAAPGSGQPNLSVGADGKLYLSWIEPAERAAHALRFSSWEGTEWSAPRTVAEGDDWFVNWADIPSMAALQDGTLAAHWLVKQRDGGAYAYDVQLAVSLDGGESWSDPTNPHRDGTVTEHGFVSLVPLRDASFAVIWLDGRETAHGGAMALRHATLDRQGRVGPEDVVDDSVCDCCSTDALLTDDGTLLTAYRDRTPSEIRDIEVARRRGVAWSAPALVHADSWEIHGCPVNGPALAAADHEVACAWFTAPDPARGIVQVAFSRDGGRKFEPPVQVDEGSPLGRVDVTLLDDGSALVSWLGQRSGTAAILLRRVYPSGEVDPIRAVAITSGGRSSGLPRLARFGDLVVLAWTETGEPSRVRTALLPG